MFLGNHTIEGAALFPYDSYDLEILNSHFIGNQAFNGGGVLQKCFKTSDECKIKIVNSSFVNNTAINKGGAILYS